jgi:hypothetical protein
LRGAWPAAVIINVKRLPPQRLRGWRTVTLPERFLRRRPQTGSSDTQMAASCYQKRPCRVQRVSWRASGGSRVNEARHSTAAAVLAPEVAGCSRGSALPRPRGTCDAAKRPVVSCYEAGWARTEETAGVRCVESSIQELAWCSLWSGVFFKEPTRSGPQPLDQFVSCAAKSAPVRFSDRNQRFYDKVVGSFGVWSRCGEPNVPRPNR